MGQNFNILIMNYVYTIGSNYNKSNNEEHNYELIKLNILTFHK